MFLEDTIRRRTLVFEGSGAENGLGILGGMLVLRVLDQNSRGSLMFVIHTWRVEGTGSKAQSSIRT